MGRLTCVPPTTSTTFIIYSSMFAVSRATLRSTVRPLRTAFLSLQAADKHTLILVRHGESTWNLENKVRVV